MSLQDYDFSIKIVTNQGQGYVNKQMLKESIYLVKSLGRSEALLAINSTLFSQQIPQHKKKISTVGFIM